MFLGLKFVFLTKFLDFDGIFHLFNFKSFQNPLLHLSAGDNGKEGEENDEMGMEKMEKESSTALQDSGRNSAPLETEVGNFGARILEFS